MKKKIRGDERKGEIHWKNSNPHIIHTSAHTQDKKNTAFIDANRDTLACIQIDKETEYGSENCSSLYATDMQQYTEQLGEQKNHTQTHML